MGEDQHLVSVVGLDNNDKSEKPKFLKKPPSELRVCEGDKLEILAHAIGSPTPIIKWLKDGRELARTNQIYKTRLNGQGDYLLEVECCVAKTSGKFTFVASNTQGEIRADTNVIVVKKSTTFTTDQVEEKAPEFTEPLSDVVVGLGKPLSLKCKLNGNPASCSVGWFFTSDSDQEKSIPLSQLTGLWSEYRRDVATAEIRSEAAVKTQQGIYQCIATNKFGKTVTTARVTVMDSVPKASAPQFTKCLSDMWIQFGDSVVFDIEVCGFPPPEIQWFRNDEPIDFENDVRFKVRKAKNYCFRSTIILFMLLILARQSIV